MRKTEQNGKSRKGNGNGHATQSAATGASLRRRAKAAPVKPPTSKERVEKLTKRKKDLEDSFRAQHSSASLEKAKESRSRPAQWDYFDYAPVAYFDIGLDYKIRAANFTAAHMLDCERSNLADSRLEKFTSSDDRDSLFMFLRRMLDRGLRANVELQIVVPGKPILHALLDGVPVKEPSGLITGARVAMMDRTESKRAELEVERAAEEWSMTFDAVPDLIMLLDKSGKVHRANRAFCRAIGMNHEDVVYKHCYEMVHKTNTQHHLCPHLLTMSDGKEHSAEIFEPTIGRHFLVSTSPIFEGNGEVKRSVHVMRDITERKKIELELLKHRDHLEEMIEERTSQLETAYHDLRESETRFKTFFNISVDLACIANLSGYFLELNPCWPKLLGYSNEELLGRPFLDFVHPEDREKTQNVVKEKLELGETVFSFENRYLTRDGHIAHLEWTAQPELSSGKIFAIARDITERKHSDEKLRKSQASLAEAQEIAHIGNWDWNIVTNELGWSDEIYRIFGLTPQQFGATYDAFLEFVHPEDRPLVTGSVNKALEEKTPYAIEHRIVLPEGGIRNVYERGKVIFDDTGKPIRMIGTVQDITERKKMETERENAKVELEKQRVMSLRADRLRSLGEMATGIAHELNQPLMGIRNMLEHVDISMKRGWELDKEQLAEKTKDMLDQVDRMSHVIEHTRLFARGGAIPDHTEPLDVNFVITDAVNLLGAQLKSRGIELVLKKQDSLPPVLVNRYFLEEVVLNLANNARDAMQEAIKSDQTLSPRLTIRTSSQNIDGKHSVKIEIKDDGVGMTEEVMQNIFEPFFSTKGPENGTGLGLAICKKIVEQFNGNIMVESKPGKGTKVTIIIPAYEAGCC